MKKNAADYRGKKKYIYTHIQNNLHGIMEAGTDDFAFVL